METTRRPYLLNPGEPLLLASHGMDVADHAMTFNADTGLAMSEIYHSTVTASPLPLYLPVAEGARRFSEVPAAMMWHPLFWLPSSVFTPYVFVDPDTEEETIESADCWAVRISLVMTVSGMYDPINGTWLDILSVLGIDVDDEVDQARIREWQEGEADEELDSIDLTELFSNTTDPDWAVDAALTMVDLLVEASWSVVASDLADILWEATEGENHAETSADELRGAALSLAIVARHLLSRAHQGDVAPEATDAEAKAHNDQWWTAKIATLSDESVAAMGAEALGTQEVHPMIERLGATALIYSIAVEKIDELSPEASETESTTRALTQ